MTQYVIANNVNTQLAASASSGATTLTLASSTNLPTLSSGQIMPLTLNDAATGQNYEIVYVTAITGVTLTVIRAQEGTGALTWNVGDYAFCGPTAGTVATAMGNPGNTFAVANATTSNQAMNLGQAQDDFASINGSSTTVFSVAPATASQHAVNLGQFASSLATSGYTKLPNGAYFQWGQVSQAGQSLVTYNFPIAFPNGCFAIFAGKGSSINLAGEYTVGAQNISASQFQIANTAAATGAQGLFWFAIGH